MVNKLGSGSHKNVDVVVLAPIRWTQRSEWSLAFFCCAQILIENGGATGVEYVQDGEKRIAKLAAGGEVRGKRKTVQSGGGRFWRYIRV